MFYILACWHINVEAYSFSVDGIYYNVLSSTYKSVSVTFANNKYASYSGNVVVPSKVTYNGVAYTVVSIGSRAFCNSEALNSVELPNTVTSIGDEAFYFCKSLKTVNLPTSLESIDEGAFYYCTSLESANMAGNLQIIGDAAFRYCKSLKSVTIPRNVISIGECAFSDCSGITSFVVEKGNAVYDSRDNCNALIDSQTNTIIMGTSGTKSIPATIVTIGSSAFSNMSNLNSISIPNSITKIESLAFAGCSRLEEVIIPNSVTSIGRCAFENCYRLKNVSLSSSLKEIADEMFWNCSSLQTVSIPNSVKKIGQSAFYGCKELKSIVIPKSVESISNYAFGNCTSLNSVTIEAGDNVLPYSYSIFYGVSTSRIALEINGKNAPYYVLDSNWSKFNNMRINGYIPGDANNDQMLTVADVTTISEYIIGKIPSSFNRDAADISWDGDVNITDLTSVIDRIMQVTNNR